MGKPQFIWNGNSLDNNTSRFIDRPVAIAEDPTGLITLTIQFLIQADTTLALQALYDSTRDDFNGQDKAFSYTLDAAVANKLLDIAPYSSSALTTGCAVSIDSSRKATKYAIPMVLIAAAQRPTPLAGAGGIANTSLRKVTTYTAGRIAQIQVVGEVYPTDDDTAAEVYASQRETILTDLLTVSADGSRDATSGMALIGEVVEDVQAAGGAVSVVLTSEYQPLEYSGLAGARRISMHVRRQGAENWQEQSVGVLNSGTRPYFYSVAASVEFDRSVVTTYAALAAKQASMRAETLAAISRVNGGEAAFFVRYEATIDATLSKITVAAVVQSGSPLLEYRSGISRRWRFDTVRWSRGEGDYLQNAAGAAQLVLTASIHIKTRTPLTAEEFTAAAEGLVAFTTDPKYIYVAGAIALDEEDSISGEWDGQFSTQKFSVSWTRHKLGGTTFANRGGGTFVYPQEY